MQVAPCIPESVSLKLFWLILAHWLKFSSPLPSLVLDCFQDGWSLHTEAGPTRRRKRRRKKEEEEVDHNTRGLEKSMLASKLLCLWSWGEMSVLTSSFPGLIFTTEFPHFQPISEEIGLFLKKPAFFLLRYCSLTHNQVPQYFQLAWQILTLH